MISDAFVSPLLNHLWQSTLFAAGAWLLTFALRKNSAHSRYCLWLVASLKFLIPFSWLVALGGYAGPEAIHVAVQPQLSVAIHEVALPFTGSSLALNVPAATASTWWSKVPLALLAVWACGFAALLFCWFIRWRRIRAVVRSAAPLDIDIGVPVASSPALIEPGIFGIFRPTLVMPAGIIEHLDAAQLRAIVAHELCHVRRRDNLAAAVHMLVEAVFWFHPLVWWIGARLIEERERACDEEVLRLGNEPQLYAESILKICKFCLESPLPCVSGVTGSDLKQRIFRIMTQRISSKLGFGSKLLLAAAATVAIAGPLTMGTMGLTKPQQDQPQASSSDAARPSFEVASIKPNKSNGPNFFHVGVEPGGRFVANNATVKMLVQMAYQVKESQISGGPNWINTDHYNIEAKADDAIAAELRKLSHDEQNERIMLMLQSLLADRFNLVLHRETKELPVYVLTVAKNGPKFHEASPAEADPAPPDAQNAPGPARPPMRRGIMMTGRGDLTLQDVGMNMFADSLSRQLGRVVLDQTGLKGKYDFTLHWTPGENERQMLGPPPQGPGEAPPPSDPSGPSLFTAVQEQLGLKLESSKGQVETLVIDRVDKPTEN